MPRKTRVHTQQQVDAAPAGPLEIDAYEPLIISERDELTIVGGSVTLIACEAAIKGHSVVHATADSRVTVPARQEQVIVYVGDHSEAEAASGYVYGNSYARLFLSGRARCEVSDRALVVAGGLAEVIIGGGGPTVRAEGNARVFKARGVEVCR